MFRPMNRILLSLLAILIYKVEVAPTLCTCDPATTMNSTANCTVTINKANGTIKATSCRCIDATFEETYDNVTSTISCFDPTPTEPSVNCSDWNADGICDNEQTERCTNSTLSTSQKKMSTYVFYFLTAWIVIWCVLTMTINISHKNSGHHRLIHLFEELAIVFLAVVIFSLNVSFQSNQKICKIVAILSHFCMVLLSAAFLMEAIFTKSMVHGDSKKDGSAFPVFNYVLPVLIALVPTLVTYFMKKDYYAVLSGRFCFSTASGDMFWAFVIPNWILIFIAGLLAQLSCLACDKTTPAQDQSQCFWSKKSAKSLLLFALLLFTIWLLVLFAGNEQAFFLFVLVLLVTLIAGPTIFVVHTFCHINTCQKWGGNGGLYAYYRLCPEKPKKQADAPSPSGSPESRKKRHPASANDGEPQPSKLPQPPEAVPENKNHDLHTESSHFYSWLTAFDNKARRSSEILFRPKLA